MLPVYQCCLELLYHEFPVYFFFKYYQSFFINLKYCSAYIRNAILDRDDAEDIHERWDQDSCRKGIFA